MQSAVMLRTKNLCPNHMIRWLIKHRTPLVVTSVWCTELNSLLVMGLMIAHVYVLMYGGVQEQAGRMSACFLQEPFPLPQCRYT